MYQSQSLVSFIGRSRKQCMLISLLKAIIPLETMTVCMSLCVCHCGQVTLLKKLRVLCLEDDPQVAVTIRKLSMVSLMTVFRDLVPRYVLIFVAHYFQICVYQLWILIWIVTRFGNWQMLRKQWKWVFASCPLVRNCCISGNFCMQIIHNFNLCLYLIRTGTPYQNLFIQK